MGAKAALLMGAALLLLPGLCLGDWASTRLYEVLLRDYERLARPVPNVSQALKLRLRIQFMQLYDINEKQQIMTSGLILHQEWRDAKLTWKPEDFDGIKYMTLPSHLIWRPDLVLYNRLLSAGGSPSVSSEAGGLTKAKVGWDGLVRWSPPVVFRSLCEIDVTWFPYDVQRCLLKFGTWSYDGSEVELEEMGEPGQARLRTSDAQLRLWDLDWDALVDLRDYHASVEWDLVEVAAQRRLAVYPCCPAPFIDLSLQLHLRRKALFYTVNLVGPCLGLSIMTSLVFHLPADSYGKMAVSISILVSTTVFFLLLVEMIPASSLVVPLIARYLLFTLFMVFMAVVVTTGLVNLHFRTPTTHRMAVWVRRCLLRRLPRLLGMKSIKSEYSGLTDVVVGMMERSLRKDSVAARQAMERGLGGREVWERRASLHPLMVEKGMARRGWAGGGRDMGLQALRYTASSVALIVHKMKRETTEAELEADWRYLVRVLDRLFFLLFTTATTIAAATIILSAPTLYDTRPALTQPRDETV